MIKPTLLLSLLLEVEMHNRWQKQVDIQSHIFVWSTKTNYEATEFTSHTVQAIHHVLNCKLKVISPYNHGSSKVERQIKTISDIIVKHFWDKGQMWSLFMTAAAYAMTTFASEALNGSLHSN